MIHSRALTEVGRTHNHWRSMHRATPQLRLDTVSRRGAPDADDGSAAPPGVYLLPRGVSPLAGRPSLATSWSSSIGNLLNRNTIPSVEPRTSGVTIHNRASTEYMDENVTFGFVDASDTRDIGRADALTPYLGGRCDRSLSHLYCQPLELGLLERGGGAA